MGARQASPMFDARIAAALIEGPVLALVIHAYAQPLLLPAVICRHDRPIRPAILAPVSRRRMVVIAGLLGFNLLGFCLHIST